ncbi:MAG: CoA transferase [Spongiibacteraceae bacterium]
MTTDIHHTTELYANTLLREAGLSARVHCAPVHPAERAAQCGLMALTGRREGPVEICPAPLAACADGVIAALRSLDRCTKSNSASELNTLDGAALLGERAASFGYARAGAVSSGGSCRLLAVKDGYLAINLARDSDWELIPAWLEIESTRDWQILAQTLRSVALDSAITRGRLLGLAVCAMASTPTDESSWFKRHYSIGANSVAPARENKSPLVIDLSSLWAGPLCGHLLQMLGARVIKVESSERPDGARFGDKSFFDLLNANKECVALPLNSQRGREQLRELILRADIVIEASRPRALRQMNIIAEEIIAKNPALTWLSITGYGRDEPQASWVAFGDDAGVAAGLSQLLFDTTGEIMFCADAIADPLTGMHAALIAWASYLRGGGELIALSLRDVVAHCAQFCGALDANSARERYLDWRNYLQQSHTAVAPPRMRQPKTAARALGADTQAVLAEFDIRC